MIFFRLGRLRLALILIGGVEVGGVGDELGGAGVDPLEDRPDAEGETQLPDLLLALPPEAAEELVGEAVLLGLAEDVLRRFVPSGRGQLTLTFFSSSSISMICRMLWRNQGSMAVIS